MPNPAQLVSEAWARGLADAGVDRVFGVPGGGPNLIMVGAAQRLGIDFVLAHGETQACIMAAIYGRSTGTCGVAIVTRGPGLTSAINGIASAQLDRLPLLVVSDTVSAEQSDRIAHQRLDQIDITRAATKWSGVIGHENTQACVSSAIRLAQEGTPGSVHLDFDPHQPGTCPPAPAPDPDEAGHFSIESIKGARKPVVIVGTRVDESTPQLRAALARSNAPILTTYHAKGSVNEQTHAAFAGMFTGVTADGNLLEAADLILGLGVDSVEPMPGPWNHAGKTLLLNPRPMETSYFGDATVIDGPLEVSGPSALGALIGTWDWRAQETPRESLRTLSADSELTPASAVQTAFECAPEARITVDAGAHMLPVMQLWAVCDPTFCAVSNGLATMGFALPAAIGLALAHPDERVICHVGDGGLAMVLGELETLSRYNLNITVLVYNDASLSLIKLKQQPNQGDSNAVDYRQIDFSTIAEAMKIPGEVVATKSELRTAISQRVHGPRLIDMRLNPESYTQIMLAARG